MVKEIGFATALPSLASLLADEKEPEPLLTLLDQLGCGGVLRDPRGLVTGANETAISLARPSLNGAGYAEVLRRMLQPLRGGSEVILLDRPGARSVAAYQIGSVAVMVALDTAMVPREATLERLFHLTAAEATVARYLAAGLSLRDVCQHTGAKLTTVRTQLAALFSKTHTRRQGELVALLVRVACLP